MTSDQLWENAGAVAANAARICNKIGSTPAPVKSRWGRGDGKAPETQECMQNIPATIPAGKTPGYGGRIVAFALNWHLKLIELPRSLGRLRILSRPPGASILTQTIGPAGP